MAKREHEDLQTEYLKLKNVPPLGAIMETEGEMAGTQTLRSNTITSQTPAPDGVAFSSSFKLNETNNDVERSGTFRDYRATNTYKGQQLDRIDEESKTKLDNSGVFLTGLGGQDQNQSDYR